MAGPILHRDWIVDATTESFTRREYLAELRGFLERLTEIEDVRFKVKSAEFDPARPGHGSAPVSKTDDRRAVLSL